MNLSGLTYEEKQARWIQMRTNWRLAHPDLIWGYHRKHALRPETTQRKLQWARDHKEEINARRRAAWAARAAPPTIGVSTEPIAEMAQEAL